MRRSHHNKLQRCLRERWPYNVCPSSHNLFFIGSRFHFAFDDFDNTECSSDLFYRNTNIWKVEDVCPAPKIWLPYTQTDYKHQSLPSYVREKRQSDDKECNSEEEGTCASQGVSIDLKYCVENELYTAEKIREDPNQLCCLEPKFKGNAKRQGGDQNFETARDECCLQYKDKTKGVDQLKQIGCPYVELPEVPK